MSIKDKYAFVGLGLTKQGRVPDLNVNELATQAILLALEDAGMKKQDVDGYIYQPGFGGGPVGSAPIVAAGIPAKFAWEMQCGSATGISTVIAAIGVLEAGLCQACLLVYSSSASTAGVLVGQGADGPGRTLWGTYGFYAPASIAAGMAQRYRHLYGLTDRQLGSVAVTLREYANQRPDAVMYNKKLTMEDYLNSPYIVEPLRVRDCCLVNDGAVALIITSKERAKNFKKRPVYVMGCGIDHSMREIYTSRKAIHHWDGIQVKDARDQAFKTAGITLKDIDVGMIYDAFTIFLLSALEGYGICGKGEAGAFVEAGNLKLDGEFPCNTSGTELSWSYLQGFTNLVEGIRQMRGESGACQVKDAEICLVTGSGGSVEPAYGSMSTCCVLRR